MSRYLFRLPDIGEGITEAEIGGWHIAVGDQVEEDQGLVDVITDKASIELTSPVTGTVVALHGEVGQRMAVRSTLVELELKAESGGVGATSGAHAIADMPVSDIPAASIPAAPSLTSAAVTPAAAATVVDKPLASPATRRRAREHNISLQQVVGSGPHGRITADDLAAYIEHTKQNRSGFTKRTEISEIKITGVRRKIAEKMQESTRRIPHFSYVEEFDMTELETLRRELNAERKIDQPKLTLLPFFMRALVKLIAEFPLINSRYDDEAGVLRSYAALHIGIATQTDAGLMVPVVRHVEALDVWGCARELIRVTTAARAGKATRDELTGSTITLTSLGALGGIAATPIINHPEVAIIGPNKLVERPVVLHGQIAIRTLMNLSSSFDHRIIDGYDAARFVQRLKHYIECPALIFVGEP